MITSALLIYGKFLLSTLLLLALYFIVLRKKASYKFMRLFLITTPILSLMMSGLSFEVYKPEPIIINKTKAEAQKYINANPLPLHVQTTEGNLYELDYTKSHDALANVFKEAQVIEIVSYAVIAVSAILLLAAIISLIKMLWLSSQIKAEQTDDGFSLVRSKMVKTPFSFRNTIFLPITMSKDKEHLVLEHEKAHIMYKHYVDVWLIEFMTRLLWFNPLLWVVRSQVRNVHEYEADRYVLDGGADMLTYQTFLLEEVAPESIIVANGFNHSFIRQRFIEMRHSTAGTLGKLGKTGTGIWILLLFCLFTFTIGEAEVIVNLLANDNVVNVKPATCPIVEPAVFNEGNDAKPVEVEADSLKHVEEVACPEIAEDIQTVKDDEVQEYTIPATPQADDDLPVIRQLPANIHADIHYKGLKLRCTNNATYLDCIATCESNDEVWSVCGSETYLIDANTGVHYKLRGCSVPETWQTKFHVAGMKGKTWMITLIFPPLEESVTYIKISGVPDWESRWWDNDHKVKDML